MFFYIDKDKDTHRKYVFYQFTILVKIWLISRVILSLIASSGWAMP